MDVSLGHWIFFNVGILFLLSIDLWRFYNHPHKIEPKEAIWTSLGWVFLALFFNGWIFLSYGLDPALNFLAAYLLEKSLSVDNLFVFLLIFSHFNVPDDSKHVVLFYGVLGAIVMRALLIWAGIELIGHFGWVMIVFAIFLIYVGLKLMLTRETKIEIEKNYIYQLIQSIFKTTTYYSKQKFFIRENGHLIATPLLVVLILIESIDLIFALDSVPAVLGITTDPFIVYTSNIFAILGLRSLFFLVERLIEHFYLLHYAVALILTLIGFKILIEYFVHIPIYYTLGVLIGILGSAVLLSHFFPKVKNESP